jgi:hypothetical protein
MSFIRYLEPSIIENLQKEDLWKKLKPDVRSGEVFMAIRNRYIGFYHKGSNLFNYKNGQFQTHKKFAAVIDTTSDYITQDELATASLIKNFVSGYGNIKKLAEQYGNPEGSLVFKIFRDHSYAMPQNSIVALDTEVVFESLSDVEKSVNDRIDVLLFDKNEKKLKFIEVKRASDSRISSPVNKEPEVVAQMARYNAQIVDKRDEILKQYANYMSYVNQILGIDLPDPEKMANTAGLLVTDFDRPVQKDESHKKKIKKLKDAGLEIYEIGKTSSVEPITLASWLK